MTKLEKLIEEFNAQNKKASITHTNYGMYQRDFITFLVDKIERLENPLITLENNTKKGGDTHGNRTQKQSEIEGQ